MKDKKIIVYVVGALVWQQIGNDLLAIYFSFNAGKWWLNLGIRVLLFAAAFVLLDAGMRLYTLFTQKSVDETVDAINAVGAQYQLPDGTALFQISQSGKKKLLRQLPGKRTTKKYRVFFVIPAKSYLSWMEFVYFDFLAKLKAKLNMEVVIALQSSEDALETGSFRARDAAAHEAEMEKCERIIRQIIGSDVQIKKDSYFKNREAKEYALEFHALFVEQMLQYTRMLEKGEIQYEAFKHKISLLESIFPIIALTAKGMKGDILFILDRANMHEIWQRDPLKQKVDNAPVCFVDGVTLRDSQGNAFKLSAKDGNIDFLASSRELKKQIADTPENLKQIIIKLLYACLQAEDAYDEAADVELHMLIQKLRSKYDLEGKSHGK